MKIFRLLFQLLLIILVVYFGYFYFTHDSMKACVSEPLASLIGKTSQGELDSTKVNEFLAKLGTSMSEVAQRGSSLSSNLSAVETDSEATTNSLLDKGQYLYCKAVVDKVENPQ